MNINSSPRFETSRWCSWLSRGSHSSLTMTAACSGKSQGRQFESGTGHLFLAGAMVLMLLFLLCAGGEW